MSKKKCQYSFCLHYHEFFLYRVSHQYGNTFNFNFLILYQCYWKSKTCLKKYRSKPSKGHLDFVFFQKIRLFFRVDKKRQKINFFLARPHPLFFKMSHNFVFSDSCTPVHGILFLLQIHVPGYIEFCFFFKFMYPGT